MLSIPFFIFSILTSSGLSGCYPCSKIVLHSGIENDSGSTWVGYERVKTNLFYSKHQTVVRYTHGPRRGKLGITNQPFKSPEQTPLYIFSRGQEHSILKRQFFDFKNYYDYQQNQKSKTTEYESHAPGGPSIQKDEDRCNCFRKMLKCLTSPRT